MKDRLLSQAVLNFTLRPRIHRSDLPLHGIILLVGESGTGKTSLAYKRAVRYFLTWAEAHIPEKSLAHLTAGDVGRYLRGMPGGMQKKKQHLAGLRTFCHLLVERMKIGR